MRVHRAYIVIREVKPGHDAMRRCASSSSRIESSLSRNMATEHNSELCKSRIKSVEIPRSTTGGNWNHALNHWLRHVTLRAGKSWRPLVIVYLLNWGCDQLLPIRRMLRVESIMARQLSKIIAGGHYGRGS